MKNLKQIIKILQIEKEGSTGLEEKSNWYSYTASKGHESLKSFIILKEDITHELAEEQIRKHIEQVGFENFIKIKSVSPDLKELIKSCHSSENEMYFVEYDDEEWSEEQVDCIENEWNKFNIDNCMVFGEDSARITVFGGISSVVNFAEGDNDKASSNQFKENMLRKKTNKDIEKLREDWINDFKQDLFEGIEIDSISEYILICINEHMPIWIEEDIENEEIYKVYTERLENILERL